MKNIKRHTTLLEVLIAMALTVIVLTTLMFFYREVGLIEQETDRLRNQDFRLRYTENRLSDILPKTVSPTDKSKDFLFFSFIDDPIAKPGSQTLIFTYDHGVSLDKVFSNHVLGRLYVDVDGNLTIAYWPSPKRWEKGGMPPMKKEILLPGVEGLAFEFFVAPEKKGPEIEPKGDWRTQPWLKDFNALPVMLKLKLKMSKEQEQRFVFPLANNKSHILYD